MHGKLGREECEVSQATMGSLKIELMEASREVAAARKRAAESERALHTRHEISSRIHLNASSSFSKEISQATRRAAECERSAETAHLEKEEAEKTTRDLNLKVTELKVGNPSSISEMMHVQ